ncbi:MAG: two-component system sensor histidine kinase response regulator [Anaerocolumna sp.]|jgi:DNA-binding response OmpR family regulator|nr:two-component system sensor histidine kinase response regulator [Anaerocolumna sp.]
MKKILIVEDDIELQQLMRQYLKREGFSVYCTPYSTKGMDYIKSNDPDLILLDVFLPDANGLDLCSQIRRVTKAPITIISAKGDESDKVLGLGLGADDFVTKPFSVNELVARVKAQLRRSEFIKDVMKETTKSSYSIVAGPLVINIDSRMVYCREIPLTLTAKEFDLLTFFANNEDRVYNKDFLYETIWGYDSSGDSRTVTVHIRKLREKIELDPNEPKMILNVWGVGYKFTTKGAL